MKNAAGEVVELRCTYDPATKGGNAPDGRKVKATMHWVSAKDSVPAEIRLYNQLFTKPDPNPADFANELNPNSLEVIADARVEPALATGNSSDPVQFERQGYFCPDKDFDGEQARVQSHRRLARHLGESLGRRLASTRFKRAILQSVCLSRLKGCVLDGRRARCRR